MHAEAEKERFSGLRNGSVVCTFEEDAFVSVHMIFFSTRTRKHTHAKNPEIGSVFVFGTRTRSLREFPGNTGISVLPYL